MTTVTVPSTATAPKPTQLDNVVAPTTGGTVSQAGIDSMAKSIESAAERTPTHMLRVLVVDDNALNLSVLTRLLRKRFSHVLDGAPVAVDSALKALQLLRENVFDVILMDIQMPFLSGVDCTERIRAGADGVLSVNRHVTVIAVTTATGAEPEQLYRRAGFDGIMGKPVKVDVMQELLLPLSKAAQHAKSTVRPVRIDRSDDGESDDDVTPSVPVMPIDGERVFFVPSVHRDSPHAPSITKSSDFEKLLRQQTRTSLHRFGAYALARTGTLPGSKDRRRLREYDVDTSGGSSESEGARTDGDGSPSSSPPLREANVSPLSFVDDASPRRPSVHRRQASLTISQSRLQDQLQREMNAAKLGTNKNGAISSAHLPPSRPQLLVHCHRHSTPDFYTAAAAAADDDDDGDDVDSSDAWNLHDLAAAMERARAARGTAPASPPPEADAVAKEDLSMLASPKRRVVAPPALRIKDKGSSRPGLRPHQQHHHLRPCPGDSGTSSNSSSDGSNTSCFDRRRSSADQSTTSSTSTSMATSEDSDIASDANSFPFGVVGARSNSIAEHPDEQFDSPLTSPDTEYAPRDGDGDGDGDDDDDDDEEEEDGVAKPSAFNSTLTSSPTAKV